MMNNLINPTDIDTMIAAPRLAAGRPLVERLVYSDGTFNCFLACNIKTGDLKRFKTEGRAWKYAYRTQKTRRATR